MMRGRSGRGANVDAHRKRRLARLALAGNMKYADIQDDSVQHFGAQHAPPSKSTITRAKQAFLRTGDAAHGEQRVCPGKTLTDGNKETLIRELARDSRKRTRGELQHELARDDPTGRKKFARSTIDDAIRGVRCPPPRFAGAACG